MRAVTAIKAAREVRRRGSGASTAGKARGARKGRRWRKVGEGADMWARHVGEREEGRERGGGLGRREELGRLGVLGREEKGKGRGIERWAGLKTSRRKRNGFAFLKLVQTTQIQGIQI